MNTNFEITSGILVKYLGREKDIEIPQEVREIGDSAFYGCNTVETVALPKGMKNIGRSAFAECMNLRRVIFPQGLEVISDAAFEHCPMLEEALLPDSVQYIGRTVFSKCNSLRTVRLPKGLQVISHGMFMGDVSLTQLELPDCVTGMEDFAFYFCKSLEELVLPNLVVDVRPHTLYGCTGLKRGYIAGINLARYGQEESQLFSLLYLTSKERYSYWEAQLYEMFIREYKGKMCRKILDSKSYEALNGLMELDILDEADMDAWIEMSRASGDIEFTAKLLQYKQKLFSKNEDMWEI